MSSRRGRKKKPKSSGGKKKKKGKDRSMEEESSWAIFQLKLGCRREDATRAQIGKNRKLINILLHKNQSVESRRSKLYDYFDVDDRQEMKEIMKKFPVPKMGKEEKKRLLRGDWSNVDYDRFIEKNKAEMEMAPSEVKDKVKIEENEDSPPPLEESQDGKSTTQSQGKEVKKQASKDPKKEEKSSPKKLTFSKGGKKFPGFNFSFGQVHPPPPREPVDGSNGFSFSFSSPKPVKQKSQKRRKRPSVQKLESKKKKEVKSTSKIVKNVPVKEPTKNPVKKKESTISGERKEAQKRSPDPQLPKSIPKKKESKSNVQQSPAKLHQPKVTKKEVIGSSSSMNVSSQQQNPKKSLKTSKLYPKQSNRIVSSKFKSNAQL